MTNNWSETCSSRRGDIEQNTTNLKDKIIQVTWSEQQKEEPMFKIKNNLRDLWYIPSTSTFGKVLSQINVEYFQKRLLHNVYWI